MMPTVVDAEAAVVPTHPTYAFGGPSQSWDGLTVSSVSGQLPTLRPEALRAIFGNVDSKHLEALLNDAAAEREKMGTIVQAASALASLQPSSPGTSPFPSPGPASTATSSNAKSTAAEQQTRAAATAGGAGGSGAANQQAANAGRANEGAAGRGAANTNPQQQNRANQPANPARGAGAGAAQASAMVGAPCFRCAVRTGMMHVDDSEVEALEKSKDVPMLMTQGGRRTETDVPLFVFSQTFGLAQFLSNRMRKAEHGGSRQALKSLDLEQDRCPDYPNCPYGEYCRKIHICLPCHAELTATPSAQSAPTKMPPTQVPPSQQHLHQHQHQHQHHLTQPSAPSSIPASVSAIMNRQGASVTAPPFVSQQQQQQLQQLQNKQPGVRPQTCCLACGDQASSDYTHTIQNALARHIQTVTVAIRPPQGQEILIPVPLWYFGDTNGLRGALSKGSQGMAHITHSKICRFHVKEGGHCNNGQKCWHVHVCKKRWRLDPSGRIPYPAPLPTATMPYDIQSLPPMQAGLEAGTDPMNPFFTQFAAAGNLGHLGGVPDMRAQPVGVNLTPGFNAMDAAVEAAARSVGVVTAGALNQLNTQGLHVMGLGGLGLGLGALGPSLAMGQLGVNQANLNQIANAQQVLSAGHIAGLMGANIGNLGNMSLGNLGSVGAGNAGGNVGFGNVGGGGVGVGERGGNVMKTGGMVGGSKDEEQSGYSLPIDFFSQLPLNQDPEDKLSSVNNTLLQSLHGGMGWGSFSLPGSLQPDNTSATWPPPFTPSASLPAISSQEALTHPTISQTISVMSHSSTQATTGSRGSDALERSLSEADSPYNTVMWLTAMQPMSMTLPPTQSAPAGL